MDVGIIGAGPVGTALATGLARIGSTVHLGVRAPADPKYRAIASVVPISTIQDVVDSADVVILAIPATALPDVVPALKLRAGQTLVDSTNAVRTPVPTGFTTLGAFVASLCSAPVHFVKAFNTMGAEHLSDGHLNTPASAHHAFLPIAGDEVGRRIVGGLATDLGFDVAELGGRDAIGLVEDHARLWIHLALRTGWARNFAFTVVRT